MLPDERNAQSRRLQVRLGILAGVLLLVGLDGSLHDPDAEVRPQASGTPAAALPQPPVRAYPITPRVPPPLAGPAEQEAAAGPAPAAVPGVPSTVLAAYRRAADSIGRTDSRCGLGWEVLAGIGRIESNHARGGAVTPAGDMTTPLYGSALNGTGGTAAIPTEDGTWARAAGPMQFIPSTWKSWSADGNGDGVRNPQNIFDASLAAARYLCAGPANLSTSAGLRGALLSYNRSEQYADTVTRWIRAYQQGGAAVPDRPGRTTGEDVREIGWETPAPPGGTGGIPPGSRPPAPPNPAPPGHQPAPPADEPAPPGHQPAPPPEQGTEPPPGTPEPPPCLPPDEAARVVGQVVGCLVDGVLAPPLAPVLEPIGGVVGKLLVPGGPVAPDEPVPVPPSGG